MSPKSRSLSPAGALCSHAELAAAPVDAGRQGHQALHPARPRHLKGVNCDHCRTPLGERIFTTTTNRGVFYHCTRACREKLYETLGI